MHESAACFHHLEWPAPGARVRGPVLFLRGWAVGKSAHEMVDVRARTSRDTGLGILGLPRVDLAAHFKSPLPWLPAEFTVAVPVSDGAAVITLEVMDADGTWHKLQDVPCTVAPDGESNPRPEGEFDAATGWLSRSPPAPFQGHLDPLSPELQHGRAPLFGWLLHEQQNIQALFATAGPLVFNHLKANLPDDALAAKVPAASQARLTGAVDAPVTLVPPPCVRIYAELQDGSIHLCFARRFNPIASRVAQASKTNYLPRKIPPADLPALPSGRPRRLLFGVLNLHPDDATLRALDVGRHLVTSGEWAVRAVAMAGGPLHETFESAGIAVQIVDPQAYFAAVDEPASATALAALERQIWWKHLDAVIAFDQLSAWLLLLARRRGIIPIADGFQDDAGLDASPLTPVWFEPALPILSRAEARARLGLSETASIAVFPVTHLPEQKAHLALHAAGWLRLHQPGENWQFVLLDGRGTAVAQALRLDVGRAQLASVTVSDQRDQLWLTAADAICSLDESAGLRPLLDAAATAVPLIATMSPSLASSALARAAISVVSPNNPLALAHALLDLNHNPVSRARRLAAAHRGVLSSHHPAELLPRYAKALESICADASERGLQKRFSSPNPAAPGSAL